MSNSSRNQGSGRRAKEPEKAIVLNPARINQLNSIHLDPAMVKILSDANLKLRFEIDANNQGRTMLVDIETNRMSGTLADIEKLAGFRRFAMAEKKNSAGAAVMEPLKDKITQAVKVIRTERENFTPTRLQPQQIAAIKESNRMVMTILESKTLLTNFLPTAPAEQTNAIHQIMRWINKSLDANAGLIKVILQGRDTKGWLTAKLFELHVPKWAYGKLTKTSLKVFSGGDYRRFLFPVDHKKGVAFTVAEITDAAFIADHQWLVSNSKLQIGLLSSQDFMRKAFNLPEGRSVDFANESDEIGAQLKGESVILTPPFIDMEFLFEPKARGKPASFSNAPMFSNPRQTLRTFNEAILIFQTFELRSSSQVGNLWEPISSDLNIDFKANISTKRNLFRVALEHKDDLEYRIEAVYTLGNAKALEFARALFPIILRTGAQSTLLREFFTSILQLPATPVTDFNAPEDENPWDMDITTDKVKMADIPADASVGVAPASTIFDPLTTKVETAQDRELRAELASLAGLLPKVQGNDRRKGGSTALLELPKEGKKLLQNLSGPLEFLKKPLNDWLRSFTSANLQAAGIGLVRAQLDNLLEEEYDDDSDTDDGIADDDEDDD